MKRTATVYMPKKLDAGTVVFCFTGGQSAGCLESDEVVDIEGGVPAKSNSSDHGGSDAAAGLALAVAKAPECRLKEMSRQSVGQSPAAGGAAFWRSGWRKKLCRCSDCLVSIDALFYEMAVLTVTYSLKSPVFLRGLATTVV